MEGRGAGQMSPRQATQQAGDGGDGWDLRALPRLAADASPAGRRAVAPCGKRGGVSESREGAVAFRVAREAMREMALLRQSVKDLFQVRTEAHMLVCYLLSGLLLLLVGRHLLVPRRDLLSWEGRMVTHIRTQRFVVFSGHRRRDVESALLSNAVVDCRSVSSLRPCSPGRGCGLQTMPAAVWKP